MKTNVALLVADDDVVPLVAVDIADDYLRADAGVVVDLVGNEVDAIFFARLF